MKKLLDTHWPALCTSLALVVAILITYAPVHENQFVDWDDGFLILDNAHVHGLTLRNIKTAFTTFDPELYTPFSLLSFQIDYEIGGLHPWVFHRTNLVLHSVNSILVLLLTLQCLGACQRPKSKEHPSMTLRMTPEIFFPCIAIFFFALHPLHTEVVAWASARKDLLCTLFYISSFITYIQFSHIQQKRFFIVSIILFLCALFSKVTAITLPVTILLYEYIINNKSNAQWKTVVPYFLLSILFGLIAILGKSHLEIDLFSLLLLAPQNALYSLSRLLIPHSLAIMHPIQEVSLILTFGALGILSLALCGLLMIQKKYPLVTFGGLFAIISILPSTINSIGRHEWTLAYDRYGYLPSIGIIICATYGLHILAQHYQKFKIHILVLVSLCIVLFGTLTNQQVRTWQNSETLFTNLLSKYPHSHTGHIRLSNEYQIQAQQAELSPSQSLQLYRKALALTPSSAEVLTNIGTTFGKMGSVQQEIFWYNQALNNKEDFAIARYNLALTLRENGQEEEAKKHLQILVDGGGFLNAEELLSQ